jgi:hypothetical protein
MSPKSSVIAFYPAPLAAAQPRARDAQGVSDDGASADFHDAESQHVLTEAAAAVARELGRQAAREYFAELMRQRDSR